MLSPTTGLSRNSGLLLAALVCNERILSIMSRVLTLTPTVCFLFAKSGGLGLHCTACVSTNKKP